MGLLLAEVICVSAFVVELRRALGGNQLSWAYVFEWPVLGLYGVYVWRKLLQEERGITSLRTPIIPDEDAVRDARTTYNDYLRRVHSEDPDARDHDSPT